MLGLFIGLVVGFILGEHNAKLRFFYVGTKRKKGEPTTQDVIVGWKK
jgi:hypothetical protein